MWLITNFGFFSIVEKPDDKGTGTLTVRARVKADLLALRERYLPELGEIQAGAGTDYKYRAKASRNAVANAMARAVFDIDYSNFKNSVAKHQGQQRAHIYSDLWTTLFQLQESAPADAANGLGEDEAVVPNRSYGGVLIDAQGRVLLREPTNHFGGYVWTFPKGRPNKREPPVDAALREVREETGYRAQIVGRVPQCFQGTTGDNIYYVMRPLGNPGDFDAKETQSICWATPEEARALIAKSTSSTGRRRDNDVLTAALKLFANEPS